MPKIVGVLSGKGGVGRSTIARMLAVSWSTRGHGVILSDFHRKQQDSLEWGKRRQEAAILPVVQVELGVRAKDQPHRPCDVVVVDGAGVGAGTSRTVAELADLVILPTSVSMDELRPQRDFAEFLVVSVRGAGVISSPSAV